MRVKFKKGTLETCLAFVCSPFLSLPFIILQIKKRDNTMVGLIALLLGLLSFGFVPNLSDDKARYYERFERFDSLDWISFLSYLQDVKRPDFVFETLIFVCSKTGLDIQWLFLCITTFTVYSILWFVKRVIEMSTKKSYHFDIGTVSIVLFSLSFSGLFSGVRFYFAAAIFIWCIYYLFLSKNIWKGVFCMSVSVLTHFSFSAFIPLLILAHYFSPSWNPKPYLIVSLFCLLLPKDYLGNIFGFLSLPEAYGQKVDLYLEGDRMVSENAAILTAIRNAWLYYSYGYLILKKKDTSKLYVILILFTAFVNITYSVPLVFNRYTVVLKILFVAYYLLLWNKRQLSYRTILVIAALFFCNFIVDVNVLRYNFLASYSLNDMLTIVHFLSKKVFPYEFLN